MSTHRSTIGPVVLAGLCLGLVGCTTSQKMGDFGDLAIHSFHARAAGAPALTGVVTVDKACHAQVHSVFAQNDLASIGVEGVLGMGQATLNGMTFEHFRRRDKFEQNISVSSGGSSGGGGAGASGGGGVGTVTINGVTANNSSSTSSTATATSN